MHPVENQSVRGISVLPNHWQWVCMCIAHITGVRPCGMSRHGATSRALQLRAHPSAATRLKPASYSGKGAFLSVLLAYPNATRPSDRRSSSGGFLIAVRWRVTTITQPNLVPLLCRDSAPLGGTRWYEKVRGGTCKSFRFKRLSAKTASLLVFSPSLESGSNPVRDAFLCIELADVRTS